MATSNESGAYRLSKGANVALEDLDSELGAVTVVLETGRQTGRGTLIGSVLDVTDNFYAEVVQHLRPWNARPPKMPSSP